MESTLNFLDWIIIIILAFMIISILIGKGEQAINLFNGKRYNNDPNRPKYNQKKLERVVLLMCISLLICELMLKFLSSVWQPAIYVSIALTVVTLVLTVVYLKKYAEEKK